MKFLLLVGVLFSNTVYAWQIKELFASMSTNITPAANYQDQASGYYSGGGISARTSRGSFSPISITPACLKTGCDGFDMFFGSLTILKADKLVQIAKAMGSQAAAYGFHLALKTFAPQIENLLKDLRNLAMELNTFAVADCQAVQSLYSAALPKDSAMYGSVCKDLQRQSGKDYFGARDECATHEAAKEAAREVQRVSENEILLDNFNLFLVMAKKIGIPEELLQATMGLAGTLIVKDGHRSFHESLIFDADTFNANLRGGTGASYSWDQRHDPNGLKVELIPKHEIPVDLSYYGVAKRRLTAIKTKMQTNIQFEKDEIDFLTSIGDSFPIYNYLSLEVVSGVSVVDKGSDLIASQMVLHYLNKMIMEVKTATLNLEGKQLNDQHFKDYLERLDRVQDLLQQKTQALTERALQTEKRAIHIENYALAKVR